MTLLEEVKELDQILHAEGWKPGYYERLTVAKVIKLLESAQFQQHSVMQAEGSDVSEWAEVGQRSVGTNAEEREIIAECKRRVDCLCGFECKLTIEEVRSSREGHL